MLFSSQWREGLTPEVAEMIWVGSFQSLHSVLREPHYSQDRLERHTWLRSEIALISPFTDWLMNLIVETRCVRGKEEPVELALREALNNAMLHGNRMDARKLVHVRCCCDSTRGVFLVVRGQGHGFDLNTVSRPLAVENLLADHGRGIHLMKWAVDQVSFKRGGTEVHIRKKSGINTRQIPSPSTSRPCGDALEHRARASELLSQADTRSPYP
jgi:serine/threonine-protein kinase RsbW